MKRGGYHRRRNPSGGMLWGVAGAAGGFLLAGSLGATLGGAVGGSQLAMYGGQAAVAVAGGWLLGKWKKPAGYGFVLGGLAALAISLYRNYLGGGSPGTSYYAQTTFPVPTSTSGNPNSWPAFSPGGPSTLPAGTSPATSATLQATGGKYTYRLAGRFSH